MMETKTKLLIAIGAAFTASCQPCLKTIIKKATDSGADKKEIAEAIGVAKAVRKNAMLQIDMFTSGLAEIDAKSLTCGCS